MWSLDRQSGEVPFRPRVVLGETESETVVSYGQLDYFALPLSRQLDVGACMFHHWVAHDSVTVTMFIKARL